MSLPCSRRGYFTFLSTWLSLSLVGLPLPVRRCGSHRTTIHLCVPCRSVGHFLVAHRRPENLTGKGQVYYGALERIVKLAQHERRFQPATSSIAGEPHLRQDGERCALFTIVLLVISSSTLYP